MAPFLFVAFDELRSNPRHALYDISYLSDSGEPFGIKVNLDAMLNVTDSLKRTLRILVNCDRPLFADLKMWNGSRTMECIAKAFVDEGVNFINVYALADRQLEKAVRAVEGSNTKILGLTVLSHYDTRYCKKWFGRTLAKTVKDFSKFALRAGCDGIIVPGAALGVVKNLRTIKMATGVRPQWYRDDRHEQEATPAEITRGGAQFMVCGSPILGQPTMGKKLEALRKIIQEMKVAAK